MTEFDLISVFERSRRVGRLKELGSILSYEEKQQTEKEAYNEAIYDVDNIISEQLDKSDNQVECQTLRWVLDVLSDLVKYE